MLVQEENAINMLTDMLLQIITMTKMITKQSIITREALL